MAVSLSKKNNNFLIWTLLIAVFMLGLSFASVPLYDLFCRVTGYAGTVQRASLAPGSSGQYKNIQIRFDSNISSDLNWEFVDTKKEIIVQPGIQEVIYYTAKNLSDKKDWFYARQFENTANADIHEQTTGIEIFNDFKEMGLDYFVSGYGTGGTFTGVARVLKEKMPKTKLIITEPDVAPLLASKVEQERDENGSPMASHPKWNPHPIQGWTTDFIPLVLQESVDNEYIDENIPVSGDDGIYWSKELASKEGIITGVSGGSTFAVAMNVAKTAPKGSTILCMIPDTAERYMSSILFDDVNSEMNADELKLFKSV